MLTSGHLLQSRYVIDSPLGQGGMGSVYRARDQRLGIDVAVKELVPPAVLRPGELAQLQAQFRQEATVLARLSHRGLVSVTDFFEEGGRSFLVMALVPGESLSQCVARLGPLPEAFVTQIATQLLAALDYCHQRAVLHRDIKPDNLILLPDGAPVLVDFGLVKLWNPANPTTHTLLRGLGTPHYASPEHYGYAAGHTDARSDIYSVGATLYFALTGQAPAAATDRLLRPEMLPPLEHNAPWLSPGLAAVVNRALALRPEARYDSAAAMRAALLSPDGGASLAVGNASSTARVATAVAAPPRRSPLPVLLAVAGVALLLAIAFLGWNVLGGGGDPTPSDEFAVAPIESTTPPDATEPTAPPQATQPPQPTAAPLLTKTRPPPTAAPPTAVPPTAVPPTAVPPTAAPAEGPVVPAGGPVAATFMAVPRIDGDLGEWAGQATYDSPFLVYWDDAWDQTNDGAARWHLGWDETNLYIAARVTDNLHVQTQTGNKIYLGDALEIQIDTDGGSATTISPREFQVNLSPGDFATLPPSANLSQGTDAGGMFDAPGGHRIAVAAQRMAGGYSVEAAVPWADLFMAPSTGQRMSIALNLDDNDRAGQAVQEAMYSNAPDRRFFNPSTWLPFSLNP